MKRLKMSSNFWYCPHYVLHWIFGLFLYLFEHLIWKSLTSDIWPLFATLIVFKLRKAFEKIVYVRPFQFQVQPHDLPLLLVLLRSGRNDVRLTLDLVAFTSILNQSIPLLSLCRLGTLCPIFTPLLHNLRTL